MNSFVIEAKRILGPAFAAAMKSEGPTTLGRMGFSRAPSANASAVLAAFAGGAIMMILLAPNGRARALDAVRRVLRQARTPGASTAVATVRSDADRADEQPSGAME